MVGSTDGTTFADHATPGAAATLPFTANPTNLAPRNTVYSLFAVQSRTSQHIWGKLCAEVVLMSTISEVLRRHGIALTETDIAADLDRAFQALPGAGAASLTAGELDYLTDHAGGQAAQAIADWDPHAERQRRAAAATAGIEKLIASTFSIEQAAQAIGVDRSRISHRLTAGTLYAVTVGGRRRIPAWQFHDGHELPGLALVVAAIPTGAHPLDIAALMTTGQDELGGRTPVEHLASGGDARPITELLAALDLW